jgi:hypothetical protein
MAITKQDALEMAYDVREALKSANKVYVCAEFEEALVKATTLIFYLKGKVGEVQPSK